MFIENKKAYELYVRTPLFKALIKIIVPGLIISLMMSVYLFIDQIMIASMVPNDGVHDFVHLFGKSQEEINNLITSFNNDYGTKLILYRPAEVIKTALTISSPITVVLTSLSFFISTGTGVIFTQAIGKNNNKKGSECWKTGFWLTVLIGIIMTTVLVSADKSLLTRMAGQKITLPAYSDTKYDALQTYYDTVHAKQISFAYSFIISMSWSCLLPCLINYFSSLIRAEGNLAFPTASAITSNVINILMDFILIKFARLGMQSGGLATLSGWAVNFIALICYVIHLNRSERFTWLYFNKLIPFNKVKFNVKIIWPILLIGLSGFLVDFTYSIAMMFYLPVLSTTSNAIIGDGEYFMTISGAVVPIMNLFFSSIWGIVDGGRPINSYNYSIKNFKRIRQTYFEIIKIALMFSIICLGLIAAIGKPLLTLFQISDQMMANAYKYLLIDMLMIPIFSFQISAVLLFQGTSNILRANICSCLQDVIVYYPTLFTIRSIALACNNIWMLIPTYVISACISSIIMTSYCVWYLSKRFGKIKIKFNNDNKKQVLYVSANILKMSLAEKALSY